jgi:tetratricopeptide (TPR) repeat protein
MCLKGYLLVSLLLVSSFTWSFEDIAFQAYREGELSKTVHERAEAFNRALKIYANWEEENQPILGNGKLYYNLGNTFYQLEEYPWAIYNYYRSLKLQPLDERTMSNLHAAEAKLGLSHTTTQSIVSQILLENILSLPQRLQLFFFFTVIAFLVASAWLWTSRRVFKQLLYAPALISLFLFCSLLHTRYFAPIEGIIVQAGVLYRDAGEQYAKVTEHPVLPGTKVQVIDVLEQGTWLKVITPNNQVGYVQNSLIRII